VDRPTEPLDKWTREQLVAHVEALEAQLPADPLTAREERNLKIVTSRWRGSTEDELAVEHHITPRAVRKIIAEWRADHPGLRLRAAEDPSSVVDELIEEYRGTAGWFAEIGRTADNPSARVGALRGRMDALEKIASLLQASGALPHDLGKLQLEVDVKYVAEVIVAAFERHSVPPAAQAEVLATLTGETGLAVAKGM
jgi:hypothetical protein